jgi:5-hydroxyisourate hydrolase-like protein (transthyretin family)
MCQQSLLQQIRIATAIMNPHSRATKALLATLLLTAAAQAASITGTVTNKTIDKPAAGDKVVLIQLAGGMKESSTTVTDAHGRFTLELPDAGPHLIRVDHEKAGYFRIAPPGTQSVDVDVYDVAEKVQGVTTEANVMRIEADQQGLHVIQNYFVKNASVPPLTQLSTHAYEIYLPEGAQIEGSAAMAPNGMPVASSPVPLGDKGHYAFVFPIRPGETRFQVSYRLPYTGSYKFTPKLAIPAENVAIMLPKSIKFTPGPGAGFRPVDEDPSTQTYLIKNASPNQPLDFTVAGLGSMPREAQGQSQGQAQAGQPGEAGPVTPSAADQAASAEAGNAAASPSSDTRPGGGLGNPIDTPDPLTKYRWWILGGLSLVLAAAAAFFLRKPATPLVAAVTANEDAPSLPPHLRQGWDSTDMSAPRFSGHVSPGNTPGHRSQLLTALKEELFALETERLQGQLTDHEYTDLKVAFETVLKRALSRQNA